ncbi:hypothetical protein HELRODRAFT_169537 [Helobdella robusta]|uniref:Uncharacterized protein n=1 Tax=Helobdella robusta TaxID=6412 RepID=T1F222_HELRO|nr:hypothetical protein HELRODRAFT_169537 [Helobdella robusta]ESO08649.1 hypothetical protein HELRODRAFT_169537 [Helobdella robusta]
MHIICILNVSIKYFRRLLENVAKVKSTPNKGENRQAAKRKLYSSGSTSEDEDKKNATLKKRKNSPSNDLSPLRVLSKPRTPQSAQRVNSVPLSERQQMALLMRQMTDESHLQANG